MTSCPPRSSLRISAGELEGHVAFLANSNEKFVTVQENNQHGVYEGVTNLNRLHLKAVGNADDTLDCSQRSMRFLKSFSSKSLTQMTLK